MEILKRPSKNSFFRSKDGRWLLRRDVSSIEGSWYTSDNGRDFFELHYQGAALTGDREEYTFDDAGKKKKIVRKGDVVTLDRKTYERSPAPATVELIPIPSIRSKAYLFEISRPRTASGPGLFIYVSQDLHHFDYNTMKFFLGHLPNLTEVPIVDVTRARDGGTTVIQTKLGELYVPTPWKPQEVATWTPTGRSPITAVPIRRPISFVESKGKAIAREGL